MNKHVISCRPDGVVEAVQNDELPLHSMGNSTMTRASDVVWDDSLQLWVATIRSNFRRKNYGKYTYANESRSRCIEWEVEYLNRKTVHGFESSQLIDEGDGNWVCKCGNVAEDEGFYPCDEQGKQCEPTGKDWPNYLYVCGGCGAVILDTEIG